MTTKAFYNQTAQEVAQQLHTNLTYGLSAVEAKKRLEQHGYNEFQRKKHRPLFLKFLDQFKSFMILVLLAAAIISGVTGYLEGEGFTDAVIILIIVVLNAIIGVAQETKAEKSLDALEKLSAPHCKVLRDGYVSVIEARELVLGDVVVLEVGDAVPADMRLTEVFTFKVQEAALTGESVSEEKTADAIAEEVALGNRHNMAFATCNVTCGRAKGVVVAVGMQSEVGKIASMIQAVPDTKTPLQQRLDTLGKTLAIAALAICGLIFVVGILYGNKIMAMFMTAVSLAAAAIPEGLPAVSTVVLAVGVQRLAKRNAIIRKLPSVETLGSTNVICSDKTGTLTQNRMKVVHLYFNGKNHDTLSVSPEEADMRKTLTEIAVLANDAKIHDEDGKTETVGDPTETALLDLGLQYNLLKEELEKKLPRIAEIPFDSQRKRMTTIHQDEDKLLVAVKGGLDELLSCCNRIYENNVVREITEEDKDTIAKANTSMAEKALRVLAVATKKIPALPDDVNPQTIEKELIFIGMSGMIDPPREEVKAAVEKCRMAGIKPIMITGDHKITAIAIADSLGIMQANDKALTGLELENMSDEQLSDEIEHISVYARVSPEHKVRIVNAFQRKNNIVAMTGDGVNDAPALKLADIGVAMGITGTDVSKEAADVVLADDNFSTIVSAVEEGRRIYDNILKAIQFLLSTNLGEVLVLFVAVLANWDIPLLPIHILWINLVTDSLPALALSVDPAEKDIMQRKPVNARKGIMTKPFAVRIFLQGIMVAFLSLTAYCIGIKTDLDTAQTMTFAVLAFTQLTLVYSIRAGNHTAFKGMFNNKYLAGSMAIVFGLMLIVLLIPELQSVFHLIPLNQTQWIWVLLLSVSPLPITELVKLIRKLTVKKRGI